MKTPQVDLEGVVHALLAIHEGGGLGQDGLGELGPAKQEGIVEDHVLHGPGVLRAVPGRLRDHLDEILATRTRRPDAAILCPGRACRIGRGVDLLPPRRAVVDPRLGIYLVRTGAGADRERIRRISGGFIPTGGFGRHRGGGVDVNLTPVLVGDENLGIRRG